MATAAHPWCRPDDADRGDWPDGGGLPVTSAIFPAARSAKNTCRRARDSGLAAGRKKISRSLRAPSSKVDALTHASMASIASHRGRVGSGLGAHHVARKAQVRFVIRVVHRQVAEESRRRPIVHDFPCEGLCARE